MINERNNIVHAILEMKIKLMFTVYINTCFYLHRVAQGKAESKPWCRGKSKRQETNRILAA